jgi:hypothetical protein
MNTCDYLDCNNKATQVSMPYGEIPAYSIHICDKHKWIQSHCNCHCNWFEEGRNLIAEDLREFIKRRPHRLIDAKITPSNPRSIQQKRNIAEYENFIKWLKGEI